MLPKHDGAAHFSLDANGSLGQLTCPLRTQTVNNTERQRPFILVASRWKVDSYSKCCVGRRRAQRHCEDAKIKQNDRVTLMRYGWWDVIDYDLLCIFFILTETTSQTNQGGSHFLLREVCRASEALKSCCWEKTFKYCGLWIIPLFPF